MASNLISVWLNSLDSEMLEELVLLYVNEKHRPELDAQRIGVSGQVQNGVDVYVHARSPSLGHWGYQCKAYTRSKLTTASLDKELKLCHGFEPPLDYYSIVTLNSRDAKLQQHVRSARLHGKANRVSIIALEDLASIVQASTLLKKHLIDFVMHPSDVQVISEYLALVNGTMPSMTAEIDQSLPDELRTAEDWINNGMPLRALAILDARGGSTNENAIKRIRCRALYGMERYTEVLAIAKAESECQVPNAQLLILGALAAEEQEETEVADRLVNLALSSATDATLPEAIGGCIRLRAKRGGVEISDLEAFAKNHLGDRLDKIAVALADSAAALGAPHRAAHWFGVARSTRPHLALGVQINELATALVIATDASDQTEISRIISLLQQLLDSVKGPDNSSLQMVILTNLGAAYRAAGRFTDSARSWDEVLALKSGQRDIWIHRCLLCEHDSGVQPPDESAALEHAIDAIAKLAYASSLISANRLPEASTIVQQVLSGPSVTPIENSIAHVERLRIRLRTDDLQSVICDGIGHVSDHSESLPLLGWLATQHRRASDANKREIDRILRQTNPTGMTSEAVLGIATPLAMTGAGISLGHWIARLKEIAFSDSGELINEHAAMVLAETQSDNLDFSGSIFTLERVHQSNPESAQVQTRLAQAHYQAGDRGQALLTLQEAIAAPNATPQSVRDWARLAVNMGQTREARKLFMTLEKPTSKSPNDYILLMQARVILGIKEDDADAIELLRNGLVTPERASQVFALGVNRKSHRHIDTVQRGTIVAIYIENQVDDKFYISKTGAPSLPGIRSLDPIHHPWIEQLLGQRSGATVTLIGEPFDGMVAEIRSIRGPSEILYAEAVQQIGLSSKEQTGVQRISGDIEFQLAEAKRMLAARHRAVEERLDLAKRGNFPAVLMAKQFQTSPREFIFKSKFWTPHSHSGITPDIEADESTLDASNGWILDATTVLLLATIDAEDFAGRLFKPPRITKLAIAQLCDWRAEERERRRSVGHMNLDEQGNLYITSRSAAERVALLKFWKKVSKIISQCRIIDVPTVPLSGEAAQLLDALGPETFATFHAAKFHGFTLIAEELSLRAIATASTGIPSAALHSLIIMASRYEWIAPRQAMLWIAQLIELGWTWVGFPVDWLWTCMNLPQNERWRVLEALSSRIQLADPRTAAVGLLASLTMLDAGVIQVEDSSRFRQIILASFPELEQSIRSKIVRAYRPHAPRTPEAKKTARLLRDWAENGGE